MGGLNVKKHSFYILIFISIGVFIFVNKTPVFSHPGNTDSGGGHTCWTNCEKWGLEYGEYHFHSGNGTSPSISTDSHYSDNNNISTGSVMNVEKEQEYKRLIEEYTEEISILEQQVENNNEDLKDMKEELLINKEEIEELQLEIENERKLFKEDERFYNKTIKEKEEIINQKEGKITELKKIIIYIIIIGAAASLLSVASIYYLMRKKYRDIYRNSI